MHLATRQAFWLALISYLAAAPLGAYENLATRGLVAVPKDAGRVFLGWRFLKSDPTQTVFNVYRKTGGGGYSPLATVTNSCNYEDSGIVGTSYSYYVAPEVDGSEAEASYEVSVTASSNAVPATILDIHNSDYSQGCPHQDWLKCNVGDLNGDGRYDFVIAWGYTKEMGQLGGEYTWYPPYDTYHLQAYLHDGTFLWNHTLNLKTLKRYAMTVPYTVYDLDGDGLAEVLAKKSIGAKDDCSAYRVAVLDGMTGEVKAMAPWPQGENNPERPFSNIGIAYLHVSEGDINPSVMVREGTYYDNNKLVAFHYTGSSLEQEWVCHGRRSAHTLQVIDYDGDGNDEFVVGSNLIDEDGNLVWSYSGTYANRHGDASNVGDLDPGTPGFEMIFGIEDYATTMNVKPDAFIIVNLSSTPQVLATFPGTDGIGVITSCTSANEGLEFSYLNWTAFDPNDPDYYPGIPTEGLIKIYDGEVTYLGAPKSAEIEWDGDDTVKEGIAREVNPRVVHEDGTVLKYFYAIDPVESMRSYCNADILGDFRDEVVARAPGQAAIVIYSNPNVIGTRRPTPMQDRYYRFRVAQRSVEYCYNENGITCGIDIPQPEGSLEISGTVREGAQGLGSVILHLSGDAVRTTSTSGSGDYHLVALAAGDYVLTSARPGYAFSPPERSITLSSADSVSNDFAATWLLPITKTITAATGKGYRFEQAAVGEPPFIDRPYTLATLPSAYQDGYTMISTAMDDKAAANDPLITLTATATAVITVCWPAGVAVPTWLSSWTDTGQTATMDWSETEPPAEFRLYEKTFGAGPVLLGPALGTSMYFVLVRHAQGIPDPPPAAPTGLTALPESWSRICLSWTDVSTTETEFRVYRWNEATTHWDLVADALPADTTVYIDPGLDAVTEYGYRVCAANGNGESDPSNPAWATTFAPGTFLDFADDFEDGNADDWTPRTATRWMLGEDGGDAAYSIHTTDYTSDAGLGEYALLNGRRYGDFHFACDARILDSISVNGYADFCVIFGYQDADNYYYMMFNAASGYTRLFKHEAGADTPLGTATGAIVQDNDFHRIEIIRTGSAITVKYDGNTILTASDTTFGSGGMGIGSYNDAAAFDNICIGSGSEGAPHEWSEWNGHRYAVTLYCGRWAGAEAEALAAGGHLATVGDEAENTWLTSFISNCFSVAHAGDPVWNAAWIGYRDRGSQWGWACAAPVTYTNPCPSWAAYDGTNAYLFGACHPGAGAWNHSASNDTSDPGLGLRGVIEVPHVTEMAGLSITGGVVSVTVVNAIPHETVTLEQSGSLMGADWTPTNSVRSACGAAMFSVTNNGGQAVYFRARQ